MAVASAGAADYAVLAYNSSPQALELNQGQALVSPAGSHNGLLFTARLDVMMTPSPMTRMMRRNLPLVRHGIAAVLFFCVRCAQKTILDLY